MTPPFPAVTVITEVRKRNCAVAAGLLNWRKIMKQY